MIIDRLLARLIDLYARPSGSYPAYHMVVGYKIKLAVFVSGGGVSSSGQQALEGISAWDCSTWGP